MLAIGSTSADWEIGFFGTITNTDSCRYSKGKESWTGAVSANFQIIEPFYHMRFEFFSDLEATDELPLNPNYERYDALEKVDHSVAYVDLTINGNTREYAIGPGSNWVSFVDEDAIDIAAALYESGNPEVSVFFNGYAIEFTIDSDGFREAFDSYEELNHELGTWESIPGIEDSYITMHTQLESDTGDAVMYLYISGFPASRGAQPGEIMMHFYTRKHGIFWIPLMIEKLYIGDLMCTLEDSNGGIFAEGALESVLEEARNPEGMRISIETEDGERYLFQLSPDDMKYFRYPYKFAY